MKDWNDLRQAYIENHKSLRVLAVEHKVSFHSLAKVCERENWPLLRRFERDEKATTPTTPITQPATGAEPLALSMPERSANLRGAVVAELERDVKVVAETPPADLQTAQERQGLLSAIVRNAEITLEWGNPRPISPIRIAIMAQTVELATPPSLPTVEVDPVAQVLIEDEKPIQRYEP